MEKLLGCKAEEGMDQLDHGKSIWAPMFPTRLSDMTSTFLPKDVITVMTRLHFNILLWKHNQPQFSSPLASQENEELDRENCHSWCPGDNCWSEMEQFSKQRNHLEKKKKKNSVFLSYHLLMAEITKILGVLLVFRWQEISREIQNHA